MNKQEFLIKLKRKLCDLPKDEICERINFYSEIIDDRIEDGLSEQEAVQSIGTLDDITYEIVTQIISEKADSVDKEGLRGKAKKLTKGEMALIIIGSPIWIPLFIAAFAIVFSLYAVIWSIIISVWAIEIPFFIISCVSKYLMKFCVKATKCSALFTKIGFSSFFKYIFGGKK